MVVFFFFFFFFFCGTYGRGIESTGCDVWVSLVGRLHSAQSGVSLFISS